MNSEFFPDASNTNASGSNFSSINGDQNNINVTNVYHGPTFQLILPGSRYSYLSHHRPRDFSNPSRLIIDSNVSSKAKPSTDLNLYADPALVIKEAIFLIDEISGLINIPDSSGSPDGLKLMLNTLRRILNLAESAIKAYKDRPLGRCLTKAIIPEVQRCRQLLSELLFKLHGTWIGLICTHISSVWRQVFREQWDGDELASLKKMSRGSQDSLGMFIMALNSYVSFAYYYHQTRVSPKTHLNNQGSNGWSLVTNWMRVIFPSRSSAIY